MGGFSSKAAPVAPGPGSTTTTVPSTVPTTVHTPEIPEVDFKDAEMRCWVNNHEILFMSLAFISGILLTVLIFAVITLFRKNYKRSHQNLQEEAFSQMAAEESLRSQNEVTYSTLVFQQGRTPLPV